VHVRRQTAVVTGAYIMMGRALQRISAVPSGNVLALRGVSDSILKSATLAGSPAAFPLAPVERAADTIVQARCQYDNAT
jgi:translation elongation factor EF-G